MAAARDVALKNMGSALRTCEVSEFPGVRGTDTSNVGRKGALDVRSESQTCGLRTGHTWSDWERRVRSVIRIFLLARWRVNLLVF
jgi:hypothetical protein